MPSPAGTTNTTRNSATVLLESLPPHGHVISIDSAPAMQAVGRRRRDNPRITWITAIASADYGYVPPQQRRRPSLTAAILQTELKAAGFAAVTMDVATRTGTLEEKRAWLSIRRGRSQHAGSSSLPKPDKGLCSSDICHGPSCSSGACPSTAHCAYDRRELRSLSHTPALSDSWLAIGAHRHRRRSFQQISGNPRLLEQLTTGGIPRALARLDSPARRHPPTPAMLDQQHMPKCSVEDPDLGRERVHRPLHRRLNRPLMLHAERVPAPFLLIREEPS